MKSKRKDQICAFLKGIETGDEASVAVVDQDKYIQHNPQTQEGGIGLAELFKQLSKSSPKVNIVRVFEDGDYVFAHTEYDFARSNIGFEVFRFEGDRAVEHWDNIQQRQGPNLSGHTMINGETELVELGCTEANREIVRSFVHQLLIGGQFDQIENFINKADYIEHNPRLDDNISSLPSFFNMATLRYEKNHRLLAEGNFVLSVCEGLIEGQHCSFYDLFRISDGKIVEHWDTTEKIPSRDQWKNNNGKF